MKLELWVPGQLPGMNEIVEAAKGAGGTGRRYAKLKQRWTDSIALLAKGVLLPELRRHNMAPIRGPSALFFRWTERDKRRDPDNIAAGRKLILDGLVVAGVLAGDGWAHVAGWRDAFVVDSKPGCMVYVEPLCPF